MAKESPTDGMITSDDVLGKDVIDSEGAFIGIVDKLYLTPGIESIGISVDRGFFKKGLTIGKSFIDHVTPYALFLNTKPSFLLKGLEVYDVLGSSVGHVADVLVEGKSNSIHALIIKTGVGKKLEVSSDIIEYIADGIFLKKKTQDLPLSLEEK